MKHFTPRPYGALMIDHLIEHPRAALWSFMGSGKTVNVLTALDALDLAGHDVWPALAIGPLRVARKVWREETRKWEHTKHIDVQQIIGDASTREQAVATLFGCAPSRLYTINYENVAWLVERLGKHMPFRTIIPDESRRLKAFRLKQGGVMTQALAQIAWHPNVKRFIELTGTPSPLGLQDLWGQLWFLDQGKRLGMTYSGFESRWFGYKRVKDAINPNKTKVQPIIQPHADAEIHGLVADLCLSINAKDWFDLKDPIQRTIKVDLPPDARRHYREMEREFFTQIEGHDIEAFHAGAKSMKLLQLANGAAYLDEAVVNDEDPKARAWREIHRAKTEALESIVEEAEGMPVLVAYQFQSDIPRILKAFPEARVLKTEKDEDDFKAGKIPVLLAHPKSGGHGIDGFQAVTNIIAFYGNSWDLELRQQIIGRIGPERQMQAGLDRPVFVYDIVAEDTIDEDVLDRHATKISVQDALLAATKRRKSNG